MFKETAVQSSFKEVMEERQHYVRMDSVEYLCEMNMVFLEERIGAYMSKAYYTLIDKAAHQLIENIQ